MSKSKIAILVIIFFLLGILLDRAFLYYEMGEKNKILIKEQESIKEDYTSLIQQFKVVENELALRRIQDSINELDSISFEDSTLIEK